MERYSPLFALWEAEKGCLDHLGNQTVRWRPILWMENHNGGAGMAGYIEAPLAKQAKVPLRCGLPC